MADKAHLRILKSHGVIDALKKAFFEQPGDEGLQRKKKIQ